MGVTEGNILTSTAYPGASGYAQVLQELVEKAGGSVARYHAGTFDLGEALQYLAHDLVAKYFLGSDGDFLTRDPTVRQKTRNKHLYQAKQKRFFPCSFARYIAMSAAFRSSSTFVA